MNGEIFKQWTRTQLLPALEPESVVVMDNVTYHSVQVPGTKPPTSNTMKREMQGWLKDKGVQFDEKLTKDKLYEIVKREKEHTSKRYEIDEMLAENGHSVLRLPPITVC